MHAEKPSTFQVSLAVFCLLIGYLPIFVEIQSALLDFMGMSSPDRAYEMIWDNEIYFWGLVLSTLLLVAIGLAVSMINIRRYFAVLILCIATVGVGFNWVGYDSRRLRPASYEDSDRLEIWKFWYNGPGLLLGMLLALSVVIYCLIRLRRARVSKEL